MKSSISIRSMIFRWTFVFTFFFLTAFSMAPISHTATLEELRSGLPDHIMGWSSKTEDRMFTPQTIFSYIDGGAEVYKAYNMKQCLSRRYEMPGGPAIMLDIFDMGSSEDAYGVFTHDPEGEPVDLGQDGRLRPGWLSFWKDRYFVSIYAEEETASAQNALRMLAKQIDLMLAGRGSRPEILKLLPPEGLQSESIRYLHHPIILNYHYYLADQNLLDLSSQTDAVLAGYRRDGGQALMLLVSYPDPAAANSAHANFNTYYLPDAGPDGMALLENKKWAAARVRERLLMIVLEADSRRLAESLLQNVN